MTLTTSLLESWFPLMTVVENSNTTRGWSPALHNAYLDHRLWSIRLWEIRTKRLHTQALHIIQERLGTHFIPLSPPDMVSTRLRRAQHCIRSIRCDAFNKQQQHLNDLLHDAKATNNKERKQLILGLKHAEETRRCFALLVRHVLHPTSPGGLTHLLIPTGTDKIEWQRVHDVEKMEHLLEHSRLHFQQAHGTPFTQPPLSDLLGCDGLTPFGDSIYRGEPIPEDLPLDPATRLLLTHQRSLLDMHEPNTHPLEFEPLMQGFRKWSERTTTSPSG